MNWYKFSNQDIHLWVDDIRPAPPGYNIHVKTAAEAIKILSSGNVTEISLDHDLGPPEAGDGSQIANWIEAQAYSGSIPKLIWHIHSANPVGSQKMNAALVKANEFWDKDKRELV
jgi:hypothetical protein